MIKIAILLLLFFTSCSVSNNCSFRDKDYSDGDAVYLRNRQNLCVCEEDHWICLPIGGATVNQEAE
jgi:hypothetical protein